MSSYRKAMKYVAWGTSKLLWLYKTHLNDVAFSYVIESSPKTATFMDLTVFAPEALDAEGDDCTVVIFAVSNKTINLILKRLAETGRGLNNGVILYADLFRDDFMRALKADLGWPLLDDRLYNYSGAFTLNSDRPVHTTICGSWLFLEALKQTANVIGDIAEVGAYQGGNALCALQSPAWTGHKNYYIFDSFEGFPDVSRNDPDTVARGTYAIDISVPEVRNSFSFLPNARIIPGFVPKTFSKLDDNARFSIVFYDCDLYQPALDTFEYFWDRLSPGGILLIHDYFAEPDGYHGVKKATDEFFVSRAVPILKFWHSTMAAVVKNNDPRIVSSNSSMDTLVEKNDSHSC